MNTVTRSRLGLLILLILISVATLGVAGDILSGVPSDEAGLFFLGFAQLDVAVAVLTLIVVLPVIVIDFFRKGAVTSLVAVEVSWSFVLTILWIAASGQTTAQRSVIPCDLGAFDDSDDVDDIDTEIDSALEKQCQETRALAALTWIGFVILLSWLVTLTYYASRAHSRGNPGVWRTYITDTLFVVHLPSSSQAFATQVGYPQETGVVPMQHYPAAGSSQTYPPSNYISDPNSMSGSQPRKIPAQMEV